LLPVSFHNHSFQTADAIQGQFDVALALFASLGYLTRFDEFALALANVKKILAPGGIFIFDLWNGSAVLPGYTAHKVRKISDSQRQVERVSRTAIDAITEQAHVDFEFKVAYGDGHTRSFTEEHRVRFYFAQELSDLLAALGFEVLLRCPFMSPHRVLGKDDWNMTFVAAPRAS
jgi:SAM-dependent methyltransferase